MNCSTECSNTKFGKDDLALPINVSFPLSDRKSYQVELIPDTPFKLSPHPEIYESLKLSSPRFENYSLPWIVTNCYQIKISSTNCTIPIIYIQNKNRSTDLVLLYSHGLKEDIGDIYGTLLDMSSQLKCNIISYDYGVIKKDIYSTVEDKFSSDLEKVIEFSKWTLNIKEKDILLISNCLGSIPVIRVMGKGKLKNIKGIILMSPISKGYNFTYYHKSSDNHHRLKNYDNTNDASNIVVPVFLIHGQHNTVIPCDKSRELKKHFKNVMCWYPKKGNHENIVLDYRQKFYSKIRKFIEMAQRDPSINEKTKLIEFDLTCEDTINGLDATKTSIIGRYSNLSDFKRFLDKERDQFSENEDESGLLFNYIEDEYTNIERNIMM